MKTVPYESASAGGRALAETQRTLEKFGCEQFGTMIDQGRGVTLVQFSYRNRKVSLEASWRGYAAAWLRVHPWPEKYRYGGPTKAQWDAKALEIARVAVCSVLRDWVKGQMTAVECGIMSFDAVFFAHTLLPSGERVIDRVAAQKLLPEVEGGKVTALPGVA